MHDRNGTLLKEGDVVLVPARITRLSPGEDYCNVDLKSVHGRRPDGNLEGISGINTAILVLHERPEPTSAAGTDSIKGEAPDAGSGAG